MPDQNKVRYGLSNVHVGLVTETEDGFEFSAPRKYPGAVALTLNPVGETEAFYADDMIYYQSDSNNGYDGELELAYLYDWFETEYLNSKTSEEGMIVEMADSSPNPMYMMFQFNGDVNAIKHILYNVKLTRPTIEGKTREETKTPQTVSIPYVATPLESSRGPFVKAKCPPGASNYATFFQNAPSLPTFAAETSSDEQTTNNG